MTKKSLRTWQLQYKKHVKIQYLKQNTFGMWTVLYWTRSSRTQFGVSINVWRLAGDTLNNTCKFLCCNHQVRWDFLITLYNIQYITIIIEAHINSKFLYISNLSSIESRASAPTNQICWCINRGANRQTRSKGLRMFYHDLNWLYKRITKSSSLFMWQHYSTRSRPLRSSDRTVE